MLGSVKCEVVAVSVCVCVCVSCVTTGLRTEGIFRVPGAKARIDEVCILVYTQTHTYTQGSGLVYGL